MGNVHVDDRGVGMSVGGRLVCSINFTIGTSFINVSRAFVTSTTFITSTSSLCFAHLSDAVVKGGSVFDPFVESGAAV